MTHKSENSQSISPIVVIDAVFFQLNNTGIARVWRSLLQQWSQSDFASHLVILDRNYTAPRFPHLTYYDIDPYDYRYCAEDSQKLQNICHEVNATVFISTYYTTPLTTPSIFMAYDFVPENLGFDINEPIWQEKKQAILHANSYIAISQNTSHDLLRLFPFVSSQNVTVAYCGVDTIFKPANREEINNFLQKYDIKSPYLLFIGSRLSINGYKNATLLFKALSQLPPDEPLSVVCVGGNPTLEPELAQLIGKRGIHILQLEDDELRIAYSAANTLVYPSRYEGFGLPLVEAMACGCPIITCYNSSIPEVVGDAAIYVDEYNPEEMLEAIKQAQNPDIRQKLQQKGYSQVQQFSWEKMAHQIADVLGNVTDEDLQKRLIWQELRLKKAEITHKNAQIEQLQQALSQKPTLEISASESPKLGIKLLLSLIIGLSALIITFLSNNYSLSSYITLITPFTWGISLIAIALMAGLLGYYELIPAKPLRWLRIISVISGLFLLIFRQSEFY